MSDTESRALGRAAVLLLAASVVRWAWSPGGDLRSTAGVGGADVLPGLLAETAVRAEEEERRARPLEEGERLDPNRAPAEELDRLPGVGKATAEALVRGRQEGPYRTPDDLLRVRGVGPALVARIRPHLALGAPGPEGAEPPGRRGSARGGGSTLAGSGPVDINRADTLALQVLPGVGPALARRIAEARRESPFRTVDDLVRVRGIGPATVERLRPLVTVGR